MLCQNSHILCICHMPLALRTEMVRVHCNMAQEPKAERHQSPHAMCPAPCVPAPNMGVMLTCLHANTAQGSSLCIRSGMHTLLGCQALMEN